MRPSHNYLALFTRAALGAVLALGLLTQVQAQDKKEDPTGTWTWTTPGRNGGPDRKMTLKLKLEGEKLTGKLTAPGRGGESRDTDIKEGKVKGAEISFVVSREINGTTMTTKYNGKVSGDTLKGKSETERDGQTRSRDWEAKRVVEKN
jgi:hypothetical protein